MLDKYKLSLQPLPKIKVQEEKERPEKVTLDMEQIKREIMKEMMEKNRTNKKNNHWLVEGNTTYPWMSNNL